MKKTMLPLILLIFSSIFYLAFSTINRMSLQKIFIKNSSLSDINSLLRSENCSLKKRNYELTNIARVEGIAKEELGMILNENLVFVEEQKSGDLVIVHQRQSGL